MADPLPVEPVKPIALVLWAESAALERALARLVDLWGPIDHMGEDHLFDRTEFYRDEMGADLRRRVISHGPLVDPGFLPEAKLATNDIEREVSGGPARRVNIDIGYLDHAKIVLASLKPAGQKIPLVRGVYADLTARFVDGNYRPFEWTFPDLRDGRHDADFLAIREVYRHQRRQWMHKHAVARP